MKLAALFSGGKDSTLAIHKAKKEGYNITCLISIISENKDSYMFHTPAITKTTKQAESLNIPLITKKTKGKKETELQDLQKALIQAKKEYGVEGVVSGAVESIYQTTRIQKICKELGLESYNPLWQKNQIELLEELQKEKIKAIITSVAAYPLNKKWLGKKIDKTFITEVKKLHEQYGFNPAGEGGEYESYVTNSPLFEKEIKITNYQDEGEGHSWKRNIEATLANKKGKVKK